MSPSIKPTTEIKGKHGFLLCGVCTWMRQCTDTQRRTLKVLKYWDIICIPSCLPAWAACPLSVCYSTGCECDTRLSRLPFGPDGARCMASHLTLLSALSIDLWLRVTLHWGLMMCSHHFITNRTHPEIHRLTRKRVFVFIAQIQRSCKS